MARKIGRIQLLAVGLSPRVQIAIGILDGLQTGIFQPLVGILQLNRRVDCRVAGTQAGVHVGSDVRLQCIERRLHVAIILVGCVYRLAQRRHVLVVGPQRNNATDTADSCR